MSRKMQKKKIWNPKSSYQPKTLINSGTVEWQRCSGGQIIRETNTRALLGFAARELFPCNHHRHGGFGNKIIGKGTKKDAGESKISAICALFLRCEYREESKRKVNHTYPFRALRPREPRTTRVGSRPSICLAK